MSRTSVLLAAIDGGGLPAECRNDEMAYTLIAAAMKRYPVQVGSKERQCEPDMPGAWKRGGKWFVTREVRNYQSVDGNFRCPVGWLIPRKLYQTTAPREWQVDQRKRTWGELIEGDSVESPVVKHVLELAGWKIEDRDLLWELQQTHDNWLPQYWPELVAEIGRKRGWL